jgi:hypothetical protein
MYRYLLLFLFTVGFLFSAFAQQKDTVASVLKVKDSVAKKQDTAVARPFIPKKPKKERIFIPDSTHSPHKAIMRSLIVPGWGQVYNHHWWKVPVIYAALGTLGYFYVMNRDSAKEFLKLSQYREHGQPPGVHDAYYAQYQQYINVPDQSIYDVYNYYLRDRDLSILGFFGAWGINCIEAYVNAKFISVYSVDNNLSMKVTPTFLNQSAFTLSNLSNNTSYIPGIKITFTLK